MKVKLSVLTATILGLSTPLPSWAQERSSATPANDYGASLTATVTQTDNARKTEEDPIDERQDELAGGIFANYENNLIQFDAEYHLQGTNYTEDSQESRNILQGSASLRVGKEQDIADLLLSQSQRAQYNSPDDAALNENLDDRAILSATPTIRARVSSVDTLSLQGTYSEVEFRSNELRNSNRLGGAAFWRRRLSEADSFRVDAGTNRIEYPNGQLDDYEVQYATGSYTSELRNIRYTLLAGINKATFEDGGDDYQAPRYQVDAVYDNGPQTFTLHASQNVTDSSLGDGNEDGVSSIPSNDGVGIDQMERKQVSLAWDSESLCIRCDLSAFLQYRQDEYRRDKVDNNRESSGGLTLGYSFTAQASAAISYLVQSQVYEDDSRFGFLRDQIDVRFQYQFSNELTGSLFYSFEGSRGDEGSNEYSQNSVGTSITYSI